VAGCAGQGSGSLPTPGRIARDEIRRVDGSVQQNTPTKADQLYRSSDILFFDMFCAFVVQQALEQFHTKSKAYSKSTTLQHVGMLYCIVLYCIVFRHKTRTRMLITKHYGWTTRQNALTVAHTTTNKPY